MKDVQRYEFFGGIALKNHAFSFFNKLIWKGHVFHMPATGFEAIALLPTEKNVDVIKMIITMDLKFFVI